MSEMNQFPITSWLGVHAKFIRHADGTIAIERLAEARDAGINLIWADYDRETNFAVLEAAEKLGMRVTVFDDRIHRAMGDAEHRRELLFDTANDYKDYPALFNYHIIDEPGAAAFPTLAAIREILHEADPMHEAYINLLPNYASPEQLGNPTYHAHVEAYIRSVRPEIISYDHYHFLKGEPKEEKVFTDAREERIYNDAFSGTDGYTCLDRPGFFTNIEEIRALSVQYGIPFMVIVLVVEHGPYRNLTEQEIRWEVWQSVAYGSSRLSYFTYWTPGTDGSDGEEFWHWKNGMITVTGERTPHYEMVARINRELVRVGGQLRGRKSLGVFHTGTTPEPLMKPFEGYGCVSAIEGDDMTVGFFEGNYVMLANKSYLEPAEVTLHTGAALEVYDAFEDTWIAVETADGAYTIGVEPGDGILVRMHPSVRL